MSPAPMGTAPKVAWQNGAVVPWDQVLVHGRSQGAFWGANVFEGLKGYRQPDGDVLLFRVQDHLDRLRASMRPLHMTIDHDDAELAGACRTIIRENDFGTDVHVCVVAYFDLAPDFDSLGHTDVTGVHVTAVPLGRSPKYTTGMSLGVSSYRRIAEGVMPPRIKTGANYHNSRLAHHEAVRHGYDTALLLNVDGTVAEAPGSCIVMVRDGRLVTPPGSSGVLEGITVATVETLAAESGIPFERRPIGRSELAVADELFLCGTKSELVPVTAVDGLAVGAGVPGPLTLRMHALYDDVVNARSGHPDWITPVGTPAVDLAVAR